MIDLSQYPTLDPKRRKVPDVSKLDAEGRAICVYCEKRLRWNTGWGYDGEGLFCRMRCAAEWANYKARSGEDF